MVRGGLRGHAHPCGRDGGTRLWPSQQSGSIRHWEHRVVVHRLADLIAVCIIMIFPVSHYTGTLKQETHPIPPWHHIRAHTGWRKHSHDSAEPRCRRLTLQMTLARIPPFKATLITPANALALSLSLSLSHPCKCTQTHSQWPQTLQWDMIIHLLG